jgi:hypothetical protein
MNVAIAPSRNSAPRLQRFALWLALSLSRLAVQFVTCVAPRTAHHLLNAYTRGAMSILLLMALRRAPVHRRRRRAIPMQRRLITLRRLVGAEMRRFLWKGTPSERALALASMLAAPERWIAYIVRRLKRRLTKLMRLPAPRRVRLNTPALPTPIDRAINSS